MLHRKIIKKILKTQFINLVSENNQHNKLTTCTTKRFSRTYRKVSGGGVPNSTLKQRILTSLSNTQ